MYFKPDDSRKILDETNHKIVEVIGDYVPLTKKAHLNKFTGKCPVCGKPDALQVDPATGIYKCFKCKECGGNDAVGFLRKYQNMTYPQALEHLMKKFSVVIAGPDQKPAPKKVKKNSAPYCETMMSQSGLSKEDITAFVRPFEHIKPKLVPIFRKGTHNSAFEPIANGDDVIIDYYDLDGNPVMFEVKKKGTPTGKKKLFFRVRYQFPDEHKDEKGKSVKYRSPYGSSNFIFIPDKIRQMHGEGKTIDRLFVQEGEKKAEKACKHGVWSIGISGINNLAQDQHLPEDFIRIIRDMEVKQVVLLFDGDYNDLHHDIKITDNVQKRPLNFYYAARNFGEYMSTLKGRQLVVQPYVGHINKNEHDDKGIDDLLSNTLKGKEEDLRFDIENLMLQKSLKGDYMTLYKINTINPEYKLSDIWSLHSAQSFAEVHKEELKKLSEFRIGKHIWKFSEAGKLESAQPLEEEEKYWNKSWNERSQKNIYEFKYVRCCRFLQNRGFGRYKQLGGKSFEFIHITHPFVRTVEPFDIKDYVMDFTRELDDEEILEMLFKGSVQYLGPNNLANLIDFKLQFEEAKTDYQRFYFRDNFWEIRDNSIKALDYTNVSYLIWTDQRQSFPATIEKPLIKVWKTPEGKFDYAISDIGKKCQFLRFLENTSNFTWRKQKQKEEGDLVDITEEDIYENKHHLISKLAAIGYLLIGAKDSSNARAVIAMDGKQAEVGTSYGRTGKSIMGVMLKYISPTVTINGKKSDLDTDNFLWDEMTEKTKFVFLDDVRTNFNLEWLFACITGDWTVNYKGGRRVTVPFHMSPKLYITTNHAINGTGSSFTDRQWLIAFSDWYNDQHKPVDDFGNQFFTEWDGEQWNLHWNFLAMCVQIYLRFGVVEAPQERLASRKLRQDIGESFLTWADEFFSNKEKIGVKLKKKADMYDEFIRFGGHNMKYETISLFKKKLKWFCELRGFKFNPHLYDSVSGKALRYDKDGNPVEDDKSNGIESIMIGEIGQIMIAKSETIPGEIVPTEGDEKPF